MKKFLVIALISSALNANQKLRERIAQLIFVRISSPNYDMEQCVKAANFSRFIRDTNSSIDTNVLSGRYPKEFEIVKKIKELIARTEQVEETEEIKNEIKKL
ncbi:hypothetical protein A3F66_04585 [candidate division TM6 bacterium RIFCSPHIGHO2_12_FULL_32_22]|nr:MAG: hypothetical protein A3F66_04585 [candidate division TM6 bacterium RIFCSPHIGHO2_12_FULL_32_22]